MVFISPTIYFHSLVPNQICCSWCNSDRTRRVDKMGKTLYENGDITNTPSTMPNSCCSYKHYWDNKEYDNVPKVFEINVTLDGKKIVEQVRWSNEIYTRYKEIP